MDLYLVVGYHILDALIIVNDIMIFYHVAFRHALSHCHRLDGETLVDDDGSAVIHLAGGSVVAGAGTIERVLDGGDFRIAIQFNHRSLVHHLA